MKTWSIIKFRRVTLVACCLLFGVAILCATIAGFLPARGYAIDQMSQLRLLYALCALPLIFAFIALRSPVGAVVACLCLLANAAACMPMVMPAPQVPAQAKLKIMAANLWGARNKRFDDLATLAHQNHPDIICLEEITPSWIAALQQRLPDYPFTFNEGISGGTAIFSKIPIRQTIPVEGTKFRRYSVRGVVQLSGKDILIIASHTASPYKRSNWLRRNQEFSRLSEDVRSSQIPVVIAGDLNSTPWSWYFQNMVTSGHLHDSEAGNGLQPSWSTHMPLPLVPIDHCLYTNQFTTLSRKIGPNIGSDHLPLLVELGFRSDSNQPASPRSI